MENRTVLLLILIAAMALFVYLTRMFFVPLVVALTVANLFEPLYRRFLQRLNGHNGAAAFVSTLLIFLVLAVPIYLVAQVLVIQAIDLYNLLRDYLRDPGLGPLISKVESWSILRNVDLRQFEWGNIASRTLSQTATLTTQLVNRTSAGVVSVAFDTFIVFFALFFFLKDGDGMLEGIKQAMPLENRHVARLADEFRRTSKAAVSATLIIGIIQGVIGAVTLMLVDIQAWLVWGVIMTILSIIPLIGSYFIMVPAALVLAAGGRFWAAAFVLIMATVVTYGVDYLLRPRLVGKDAKMHDLLVFVASLGGLSVFGLMGFIVGPVIASVLLAMLNIFKEGLDLPPEPE
jgi:predicted PurR-regulated permease PerM